MRRVDVEIVVSVEVPDRVTVGTLDALVDAVTERFPWVAGAVVEAVVYYDEAVTQ
jgi:hypothetical protein